MTNSGGAASARIYILTTAGPVHVQRITREDPEVSSVVCLSGKAVALPISGAYDAFVRDPTGVIQRRFGHGAFRVDVAQPVDDGYSWQLALYLAHALDVAGGLAADDDLAAPAVVATGEVDRDLKVLGVDHLASKLDWLARGDSRFEGATVLVPAVNAPEAGDTEVFPVSTVAEALAKLGLSETEPKPVARRASEIANPPPRRGIRRPVVWAAVMLVLLIGAAAGGVLTGPVPGWFDSYQRGRVADLHRDLRQSPDPRARLAETLLTALRPAEAAIRLRAEGEGASLTLRAFGPDGAYLSGRGLAWTGNKVDVTRPDAIVYMDPRPRTIAWQPARSGAQQAGIYRLIVLASPRPITGPRPWFPALGGLGMDGRDGRRAAEVAARLNAVGITVKVLEHRVTDAK